MSLSDLAPAGTIAVVAPHPDDETLGCGGLIALAAAAGRKVVVIVLTGGCGSHPGSVRYPPAKLAYLRAAECHLATGVLTASRVAPIILGLPDGSLEQFRPEELSAVLEPLFRLHRIQTVFVTDEHETHADHRAAYAAARQAARAVGARVWLYPIWQTSADASASSSFVRLRVFDVLALKGRAIRRHRSQVSRMIRDADEPFRLYRRDVQRFRQDFEVYKADRAAN